MANKVTHWCPDNCGKSVIYIDRFHKPPFWCTRCGRNWAKEDLAELNPTITKNKYKRKTQHSA